MKPLALLFFFLLFSVVALGQNRNSIWCFGDSAGIDFRDTANVVPIFTGMDGRGSCVSIADSLGNLLFYANTRGGMAVNSTLVWNKNNQVMENGDSIVGQAWYNELVIVPMPDNPNQYYLFCIGVTSISSQGFYYSVIDLSLNSGLGAVVQKNIPLIAGVRIADCVKAIKHGNGRDWWVTVKLSGGTQHNRFFVYLVTPSGISSPMVQDFNNCTDVDLQRVSFSSASSKIMQINASGFMCEYNFNRCSGNISNPQVIFSEQVSNSSRQFWEGSYSPNDSLFYVSTTWSSAPNDTSRLLQYNLFSFDIPGSCDTLQETRSPISTGAPRLGPDNKIYYSTYYQWGFPGYPYPDSVYNQYNMFLSVVNEPNNVGSACDFQPFSFYLGGKRCYFGLPNNPNYQLGPLVGSPCDTLTTNINNQSSINHSQLFVFYHSGWQTAFINAKELRGKKVEVVVYDEMGRSLTPALSKGEGVGGYFTMDLDCKDFAAGVYIVVLQTEEERLVKRFVKN
jgi:hypothetical protein